MQMVSPVTSLCFKTLRSSLAVTKRTKSSQQIEPAMSASWMQTDAIRSAPAASERPPKIRRLLAWASSRPLSPTSSSTLML